MKKMFVCLLAICAFNACIFNKAENINSKDISNDFILLSGGDFKPVILDGVKTGAKGWKIMDRGWHRMVV